MFSSCTTSSYRLIHNDEGRMGVVVTGDRVIFSCEDVQDPDEPIEKDGRYGFMVLVLDNKNTYSTFVQFNFVTKKTCLDRMAKLEKMKQRSKKFYIAGYSAAFEKPGDSARSSFFPGYGKMKESGWTIGFSVFKSDDNECITKAFGDGKPCPELEGFPEANPF